MKLFCGCNSEWRYTGFDITPCDNPTPLMRLQEVDALCPVCNYYEWYDADYENMMFDLKSMSGG